MPGRTGRCERVTRKNGKRSPYAPLRAAWGTTVTSTADRRRESGNGLRFAFAWVAWYESIIRGRRGKGQSPEPLGLLMSLDGLLLI